MTAQSDGIERLRELIRQSRVITFFGGAGVSTESGLMDFRSEKAVRFAKEKYGFPPEELLSHDFFSDVPDVFYDYYRRTLLAPARPNAAHYALAELEKRGKLNAVITQNVDDLHHAAGSKRVYPLHGSIGWNRCMNCNKLFDAAYIRKSLGVPRCPSCGGMIKPEVTLYGEPLDDIVWRGAKACMFSADLLVVGGTSLSVSPAAELIEFFAGRHMVVINASPTSADSEAELVINAPIGETLAAAVWPEGVPDLL